MKSASSNRIYLWSKIFGAILPLAMAIVAAREYPTVLCCERQR